MKPPLRVTDLPRVEEGDWGLVAVHNDDETWSTAFYDDDEYACMLCGTECDCVGNADDDRWLVCYPPGGIVESIAAELPPRLVRPGDARKLPDGLLHFEVPQHVAETPGWVYAIAPVPELSLHRLKIGWTRDARTFGIRVKSYRTSNPRALVLGIWNGDRAAESIAHERCDGRIAGSEVFDTRDPFEALLRITEALRVRT